MAWLMASHIVALVIWSASLLYMPALFAEHAHVSGKRDRQRQRIITRFTFLAVASPAGVIAIITGSALVFATAVEGNWLHAKLAAVTLMVFFHMFCGRRLVLLEEGRHRRRKQLHASLVLVPMLLIGVVLWLVLAKPYIKL